MAKRKKQKTRHPGLYRLDDGRFWIRPTVVNPRTGKTVERLKRTLPHGTSEIEALVALEDARRRLRAEVGVPHARSAKMSVLDYAEQWLEGKAARLKPSTAARYSFELERHIIPHFGPLRVDQVSRADVERWVAWAESVKTVRGDDYSGITVTVWWRTVCGLLRDAAAEFDLPDPTRRVRGPERRTRGASPRERRTLTGRDLPLLLAAVKAQCGPQRYIEVCTLAWTGIRAGELFGLRWPNVDLQVATITIREAVWNGHLGLPKTRDPRVIPIPNTLVDLLRTHRLKQIADQHPGLSKGIVFPSATGGFRMPRNLRKPLHLASEEIDLGWKVTPQVLRRTYNTLLVRAGVDRIVLRSMMGHTTEALTERYSGVDLDDKRSALASLHGANLAPALGSVEPSGHIDSATAEVGVAGGITPSK